MYEKYFILRDKTHFDNLYIPKKISLRISAGEYLEAKKKMVYYIYQPG